MKTSEIAALITTLLCVLPAFAVAEDVAQKANGPADIPFTLDQDNIVVSVTFANGKTLPFIFDSGLTTGNVLTVETAEALNLTPEGRANYGDTSGNGGSAILTTVPSIRVGNAVLGEHKYAVTPVPAALIHRKGKPSIAGFLGAPLMENAVLCIDYRHKVMHRWQRAAFDRNGFSSIPMQLNHGLPTIELSIDGQAATMIVDSGNNGGVEFFPAFAEENQLREHYPNLKTFEGVSGNGESFDVYTGLAKLVELGKDSTLHHVSLSLVPQAMNPAWGIDGLAGYKVLSRVNPCLDRDGGRFLWKAADVAGN